MAEKAQQTPEKALRISVDQLTEAAFSGVIAALKANDLEIGRWPGPILVGIIAWPEMGQMAGQIKVPGQV
jgi:hypothetical protein